MADTAPTKLADPPRGLLIGGRAVGASGDRSFEVIDPASERPAAAVADASVEDCITALDAAAGAQDEWAAVPAWDRGALLRRAYEAVVERADELAGLISLESGKALDESRAELSYGADFLRWFSEQAGRISGSYRAAPQGGTRLITVPQPVGPSLLITPWNFPLAMATRKVAPALAAGCTAILKPASQAPLTSIAFGEILVEAGVPPGVVNVVTTTDSAAAVEGLIDDGRLRKLSFTGSTEVGKGLMRLCAGRVIRTSMELGGNAPLLVFDDCDLKRAVDGAVVAKLRNAGQSCIAANRIYVQRGIADRFADALVERFRAVRMGPALDGSDLGPLIDSAAAARMGELVSDAVTRGAALAAGGQADDGEGHFFPPTLLRDVADDARVMREEIFGPLAPLRAFESEDEAVHAASSTAYGLVAYVFTQDLDRALRVAERLDTGMVGINRGVVSNAAAPFGGTKESGLGREGGEEGISEYLETKYIAIDGDASGPRMTAAAGEEQ